MNALPWPLVVLLVWLVLGALFLFGFCLAVAVGKRSERRGRDR